MLKLTTDKHEASRGLSVTAELLVPNYDCKNDVLEMQYNIVLLISNHIIITDTHSS